jgi:hypothetical protein
MELNETVSIGCEFIVVSGAAEDMREALRDAVANILEDFTEEEIVDYGVD